jgi:SAM-dependent methyltransferase
LRTINSFYDPALYEMNVGYAPRLHQMYNDIASGLSHGTVMEVGCGIGDLLLELARAGHDVIGVDGSAAMLRRCREHVDGESVAAKSGAEGQLSRVLGLYDYMNETMLRVTEQTVLDNEIGILNATFRYEALAKDGTLGQTWFRILPLPEALFGSHPCASNCRLQGVESAR